MTDTDISLSSQESCSKELGRKQEYLDQPQPSYKHLGQLLYPKINQGLTSVILNFWHRKLLTPILDQKEGWRLWDVLLNNSCKCLQKQWSLVFRIWERSGYCCWKTSCKFTLATADIKMEEAVVGPKGQKSLLHPCWMKLGVNCWALEMSEGLRRLSETPLKCR